MRLSDLVEQIDEELLRKNYRKLVELPVRIKSWDNEQLQNNYKNLEFTKIVKEKAKRNDDKFQEFDVYSYKSENYLIDVFVEGEFTISFFMYEEKNKNFIEYKVWQDAGHPGLCRKILFELYLKKYNSIVSDGVHSEMGEKYWIKLMEKAKTIGYKTFVLIQGRTQEFDSNLINQYYTSPNIRFIIQK